MLLNPCECRSIGCVASALTLERETKLSDSYSHNYSNRIISLTIARMAHLSNRQQRRIRRNLAEQLVFQCRDKRTKLADSFHNADLTESPSNSNSRSNSNADDYDHDDTLLIVDKFADPNETNDHDYSDCSSHSDYSVSENDSCCNDTLESTSHDGQDICSELDCEADLSDVSTGSNHNSSNEELSVANEYSSSDNESTDDDSEQKGRCKTAVSKLLYQGANVSKHEFAVTFLSLVYYHKLTYSCAADVLKFLSQVLPIPNSVSQTYLALVKQLVNYNSNTITHRCCGYCTQPLLSNQSACEKPECIAAALPDSTVVELSLDKQLAKLMSGT